MAEKKPEVQIKTKADIGRVIVTVLALIFGVSVLALFVLLALVHA